MTFLYATLSNVIVFMSDQIFLLSDQNGALVRHVSFQGKKIICSPVPMFSAPAKCELNGQFYFRGMTLRNNCPKEDNEWHEYVGINSLAKVEDAPIFYLKLLLCNLLQL